ncbi:MAG: DUF4055 domain-containing protein [Xanthomonadales bacterium]|nr:DUF4055 domain-containing protein [Xanthomonadales bacterium]
MSVNQTHPKYDKYKDDWRLVRDAYEGERKIKERGTMYLPKPSGFNAMPDKGVDAYNAYRTRAVFPDIFSPAVRGIVGMIHGQEWDIELPPALEPLRENAASDGQDLDTLSRRVTSELLISGRVGLLADVPEDGGEPYIAIYPELSIINWDDDMSLFVLDESGYVRDGFRWTWTERWRVLELIDGRYIQRVFDGPSSPGPEIQPSARGGVGLDEIPFLIASAKDLTPEIDNPPLTGVARAALGYYRLDADYRHQLYNSGQETLVIINGQAPDFIGSGVAIELEAAAETTVDAKYIGPSGRTIDAHKEARDDELARAADAGAQLFKQDGGAGESGEARRLRMSSEAANIKSIARSSAAALEKSLKFAAMIAGANPDDVVVRPPSKILEPVMGGQEVVQFVDAWAKGGMSFTTLIENLQRGQIVPMDRTPEDETRLMDSQEFGEGEL